ncbi:ORF9 [Ranid herpesvirus 1]|uniref:ORF9 n=1 Tax=Ranid herpesvirus 1 TaxID=85655 RepID=Q14VU9_9VIRU|nr:ORF9 [Ranid herpesvirus 1]ABG25770.1 ORF9 [Ranid herpesvirus 1]
MQLYQEDWERRHLALHELPVGRDPALAQYQYKRCIESAYRVIESTDHFTVLHRVTELRVVCNLATMLAKRGGSTKVLGPPTSVIEGLAIRVLYNNRYGDARKYLREQRKALNRGVRMGITGNMDTLFAVGAATMLYEAQAGGLNYRARFMHYLRTFLIKGYYQTCQDVGPSGEHLEDPDPIHMCCMRADPVFVAQALSIIPTELNAALAALYRDMGLQGGVIYEAARLEANVYLQHWATLRGWLSNLKERRCVVPQNSLPEAAEQDANVQGGLDEAHGTCAKLVPR